MPRISFRFLLAGAAALLVVATTVSILAVSFGASRRTTYELLNEQAALALGGIEDGLHDRLSSLASLVDGLSRGTVGEVLARGDEAALAPVLEAVFAVVPSVDALVVWGEGRPSLAMRRGAGGQPEMLPRDIDSDPSFRALMESLPRDGQPGWGRPVLRDREVYLNVVARVSAAGPETYVAAAMNLHRFSRDVERMGRRLGGTAFVLYGDDGVLAHPSMAEDAGGLEPMPRIADIGDPVLEGLDGARAAVFAADLVAGDAEALRVRTGEGRRLVLIKPTSGFGLDGARIGVHFDPERVETSISRLFGSAIVGLLIGLLGVIAAILFGRIVSRPVRRLAESAEAVSLLEFERVRPPRGSLVRELDEQAQAFRLMLGALRVFAAYVPRQLVRRLMEQGRGHDMQSEQRELTVMFTDIREFSAMADRMGPEDTAAFLNRHFALLDACLTETGGAIDKYIGDSIMAFWGAPEPVEDHAARAVAAARLIAARLHADNERRARKGLRPVRLRIGIHSGPVIVGNIGAPERVNYTIVGPTVNVAQRLEELGHGLDDGTDVTVLISEATAAAAGVREGEAERLGAQALRGLAAEIVVLRLGRGQAPRWGQAPG